MRSGLFISTVALAVLASGCATMNQQECLVSDWRSVGYEDGVQGRTADRIGVYRRDCAKHGVSPDLSTYQVGRAEGLREFCQPDNGFDYGSKGNTYRGVCPADLADDFMASYRMGRQLYELKAGVQSASRQLSSRRRRLEQIDEDMVSSGTRLIADGTTSAERLELLNRAKNLAQERGRVEAEIIDLVEEKAKLEEKLRVYREQIAANY
jgi:hypothetical protein